MFVFNGGSLLALVSGVGLIALAVTTWKLVGPDKTGRAFSIFAGLWGVGVAAGNVSNLTSSIALSAACLHLSVAAHIMLYAPLAVAVASETGARGASLFRLPGIALLAAPGVGLLSLYAADPSLFVAGMTVASTGTPETLPGPLFRPIGLITGTLIFIVALAAVIWKLRGVKTEPRASRLAIFAAGLTVFAAHRSTDVIRTALDVGALTPLNWVGSLAILTALGAAACTLWAFGVAYRDPSLPWRGLILAGAIVPFLFGLSEIFFDRIGVVGFRTVGLWRLITAGILAYGIARYRLFDAELRLSAAAPALAYAATAFVAVALLWALLGARLVGSPWLGGVATFGVALACVPAATVGRRAFERRGAHVGDTDYLYKRKVDVYRAALEDSASHGIGEKTEQELLSNLRKALGISEAEHRILMLVIQSQDKYAKRTPVAAANALGDKFRVERELGRGAHGSALLARDLALDRLVVLKQPMAPWLLDDEGRARFVAEARLAARISHPNVVVVHEVVAHTEPPTIVMEYMAGGSLEDKLRSGGKLAPAEAARACREILAGLGAIHAAGMVHRDVKPANVLLDARGVAKISDFGTAQPPDEWRAVATIGAGIAGQPGTPAYMSPEQARGEDLDARSDLYSVGAILYRALTGEHYIDMRKLNEAAARDAIQRAPPRLPHAAVPAGFEKIVRTALAKDKMARYASAAEMTADLDAVA